MPSSEARFEGIADWYVEYTSDWEPEPLALLPDDIAGRRVLLAQPLAKGQSVQ